MDRNTGASRIDIASVSPAMIAAVGLLALVVLALIPARRRFYIAIVFTMAWSLVGQLPELPGQPIAKATLSVFFVLVSLAALLHPGPRLRLAPVVLWWPILAFVAVMFVLYVDTLLYALLLRFQWILLCVTALLTCRTLTSREAADSLARAIGVGLMVGVAIAATSIITGRASAFHLGRFAPYGANFNQVGVVFAAAVPFSLYCAMSARYRATRWACATMTVLVLGMLIMTASRASIAVSAICLLPFLFSGLRRAVLIVSLVGLGVMVLLPFAYQPELKPELEAQNTYGLSRLDSLETERYEIFARYLDQSVSKRPITGLLGTSEPSVLRDEEIGKHPHNAYIEMMYLGGIIYALPMLLLVLLTIAAAVRVFLERKQMPIDPLLASIFVFILAAVYVHAIFGVMGWYPTSAWAFIHVLVSCYVLTSADWLQRAARARRVPTRRGALVVVGTALLIAVAGCSGGGENGRGKPIGTPSDDTGAAQRAPEPLTDRYQRNWKNRSLPEDATPRELDVLNHLEVDASDATPDVLCAVKLDKPEDGPELRKRARALRVPMIIVAYNWVVDWRKDGQFDDKDKKRFAEWIDTNIRPDSRQLVVIDYEHPYWPELRNKATTPERLAEIAAVYRGIYQFAKARRPKARWGFFGLPHRNNRLGEPWAARTKQIGELLLRHVDVVYLSIYDLFKGDRNGRDLEAVRTYVELSLAEAGGRPVYAYVRGRYGGRSEYRDEPIPEDEFKAHVGAALDARWNDGKREHRLAGVVLWDGRLDRRKTPASWDVLDKLYAQQLGTLTDFVRVRLPKPRSPAPEPPR